jgi:hypothetical protein
MYQQAENLKEIPRGFAQSSGFDGGLTAASR